MLQAVLWHVCLDTLCKVLDADHPICPLVRTHDDKTFGITTLRLLHSNITSWPDVGLSTINVAVQTPADLAQRACIAISPCWDHVCTCCSAEYICTCRSAEDMAFARFLMISLWLAHVWDQPQITSRDLGPHRLQHMRAHNPPGALPCGNGAQMGLERPLEGAAGGTSRMLHASVDQCLVRAAHLEHPLHAFGLEH